MFSLVSSQPTYINKLNTVLTKTVLIKTPKRRFIPFLFIGRDVKTTNGIMRIGTLNLNSFNALSNSEVQSIPKQYIANNKEIKIAGFEATNDSLLKTKSFSSNQFKIKPIEPRLMRNSEVDSPMAITIRHVK